MNKTYLHVIRIIFLSLACASSIMLHSGYLKATAGALAPFVYLLVITMCYTMICWTCETKQCTWE